MERNIEIKVEGIDQGETRNTVFSPKILKCAMYCGRDRLKVKKWLETKRKEGWKFGEENPSICNASRYLLTTDREIEVQGIRTSGEVEVVALVGRDETFVTVGSDHDDRTLSRDFPDKPKQMCPKIMSSKVWRY